MLQQPAAPGHVHPQDLVCSQTQQKEPVVALGALTIEFVMVLVLVLITSPATQILTAQRITSVHTTHTNASGYAEKRCPDIIITAPQTIGEFTRTASGT